MSSYRDDTQETAVASDYIWGQLTTIAEETAKFTSSLIFSLLFVVTESAVASNQVTDRVSYLTTEHATISDSVIDSRGSSVLMIESALIEDRVFSVLQVVHQDQVTASDSVIDRLKTITTESVQIADRVIAQRRARSTVFETARATDFSLKAESVLVLETVGAVDEVYGISHSRQIIVDTLVASDQVISATETSSLIAESVNIQSFVIDHLIAKTTLIDVAVIEDDVLGVNAGQAWTANVDTWAMSRYSPYFFISLSVINGVLYGVADDGIYAINGGNELINGHLTTGKVDLAVKDALVHPLGAYLEYELSGSAKVAQMDVTTTQTGTAQTYTYSLPAENAESLTNGRFIFGRGLRGRHFTFSLRISGERGYINALGIDLAPTNRRV